MDNFIKKILTLLMAGFLLCYVGYQAFQVFYTPIKAETVYSHTMYETVDTQGFVILCHFTLTLQHMDLN